MSEWDIITENYYKATQYLIYQNHGTYWHRDIENGLYYLLKAYRLAEEIEEKNHLCYARILAMIADEMHSVMSKYDVLKKYIEPSLKEYELAQQEDDKPTEEELNKIRDKFQALSYEFEMKANIKINCENALKLIKNNELLKDFSFHDSQPIFFSHDKEKAVLKLDYNGTVATFEFNDVSEMYSQIDPHYDWVFEFYCYRKNQNPNKLIFDIGLYTIICKNITVTNIEYKTP